MSPRRKKSRKPSVASSIAAKRLERATFYLDESIYSRILRDRMRAAGAQVRHAGEALPFGACDQDWLTVCGDKGWIVLTRDEHIRRRRLEREALKAARVAVFAFTKGEATAADTADVVLRLLGKFVSIALSERRPFLWTFGLAGRLVRIPQRELR